MLTPTQLRRLRELAAAASPGPWSRCHCGRCGLVWGNDRAEYVASTSDSEAPCRRDANADYLSALSPDVVLPLLAIAESAKRWSDLQIDGNDTEACRRDFDLASQALHSAVIAAFGTPKQLGTGEPGAIIDAEFDEVDP